MKCKYETTSWYEGMKRCLGTKEVDPCPGYDKCQHFKPYRMTNADRIRSMTDEEMATELLPMFEELCEDGIPSPEYMRFWLKQPYGGAEG